MSGKICVLIADDHPIFRNGLRQVLATEDTIKIVDEVSDGENALHSMERSKPDVAILDIDMPKKNGLEVVQALQEKNLDVAIIFLTMYNDREMFNRAMDLGVRGYVLKESAARELVEAIHLVAEGRHYLSPAISTYLLDRHARTSQLQKAVPGLESLTTAERRVLKLIAEGKTSKEIAVRLDVSVRTVDNHRLNISHKLNIRGTHHLLKFAVQNKSWL